MHIYNVNHLKALVYWLCGCIQHGFQNCLNINYILCKYDTNTINQLAFISKLNGPTEINQIFHCTKNSFIHYLEVFQKCGTAPAANTQDPSNFLVTVLSLDW